MFNVSYFVVNMVGEEIIGILDHNISDGKARELIKKINEKTGLNMLQVQACIQACVNGEPH